MTPTSTRISALLSYVACTSLACTAGTGALDDQGRDASSGGTDGRADVGPSIADAGTPFDAAPSDAGSLEDISLALIDGQCRFTARCLPRFFYESYTEASCITGGGFGLAAEITARIEDGRSRLDPAALVECLEALRAGDCREAETWLACKRVLKGTLPRGSICVRNDECGGGTICKGAPYCGVCADPLPAGATCDTSEGGCDGICYARLAGTPGQCFPTDLLEGESCTGNFTECAPALYCDRSVPDDRRCRRIAREGDMCNEIGGAGPYCDPNVGRCIAGICVAVSVAAEGEQCDWNNVCLGTCTPQGLCTAGLQLNEPCAGYAGPCADGAGICETNGTCRTRPLEGEPCRYGECARGLSCLGGPQRCTSRPWDLCP